MPNGIAGVVSGFLPTALLLDSLLPQALPGCFLVVWPDWLDAVPVVAGVAQYQLAIPDSTALAGVVFYRQVVPFELGPTGDIAAITSSNGLVLRIGTF